MTSTPLTEQIENMCDWVTDFKGARTVVNNDHTEWHFGAPCPYFVVAEILRGHVDPRRVSR